MSVELFNKGGHICVAFRDLVTGSAVQANQFLIYDHEHAALLDPGGELTYTRLFMAISRYMNVKKLDYVLASHQDPDIVASVNKWLIGTECKIVVPSIWERFIPHFTRPNGRLEGRVISVPDPGMTLHLGNFKLKALPAHFLHAEGNLQFYDPISRILFSGDMGANLSPGDLDKPAQDIKELVPYMEGFHRRYLNNNKVCRFWANMVRQLDISMIVPQHGRCMSGKAVNEFIDWIEQLKCGTDLMTQDSYRVPE